MNDYKHGIQASIDLISEHVSVYEDKAHALTDMSTGKMSIHPACKMKAKKLLEHASVLKSVLPELESLKRDAKGLQQKSGSS